MFPRSRSLLRTLGTGLVASSALALAATTLSPTASFAANPITPGTFRGYGFDQCEAPRQAAMDAWLRNSNFRAVGIYISGNSRACRAQTNLTATWVANQLSRGWRLLPITLGPQASCSTRYPRYGASIDPKINSSSTDGFAAAKAQAASEASKAVGRARQLGIVAGSTLYYDLEGFDLNASVNCRNSAVWFLSSWTQKLHSLGYASGVYSSAGSGIVLLERMRQSPPAGYTNPDQLWIARWDGVANTSTSYISDAGWQHQRIKQYRGGHNETHGGVTINIDSNFLDLTTPTLPSNSTEPRATTGTYDPACTRDSISKPAYRLTTMNQNKSMTTALQCLLKQQRLYNRVVTGSWNTYTTAAMTSYQAKVAHPKRGYASRSDWMSMLYSGSATTTIRQGATGADVIRLQRTLNAATDAALAVTGTFDAATTAALKGYQRKLRGAAGATGTTDGTTRNLLRTGRF